jgi:hypothetical protein
VPGVREEGASGGLDQVAGAARMTLSGVEVPKVPAPRHADQGKERRRVGGHSRRRSPLGLARPDRDRQAPRSYVPAVKLLSAADERARPGPPRLARNIIESTFEVGRRFRCTMRVDCGQLDPCR